MKNISAEVAPSLRGGTTKQSKQLKNLDCFVLAPHPRNDVLIRLVRIRHW